MNCWSILESIGSAPGIKRAFSKLPSGEIESCGKGDLIQIQANEHSLHRCVQALDL